MIKPSPFVVDQLRPQRQGGRNGGVYQLTAASTHPTRIVGRDADGFPVEDTVPTTYARYFVMRDGCINKVPLRSGSVDSMDVDATRYEEETMRDLIADSCIPLWLCPYSTEWTHITNGPFVAIPPGEKACNGDPESAGDVRHSLHGGGCVHMQKVMQSRKERALEKHNAEIRRIESMRNDEREREMALMRDGIVKGVGTAMAEHLAQSKQRLREGRSAE